MNARFEYDLFVSYARLNNQDGWIKSYVEALAEEFRTFTGGRELKYFWDTERIPDFSHWHSEIFNKGIVKSKLFLAFLSPQYFASDVCRREWRAWIEHEIGLHILSEGASPIYIVEIPSMSGRPKQPEREVARQVAELCQLPVPHDGFIRETEFVVREFRRRQLHKVIPFYNQGLNALKEQDLRNQLLELAKRVDAQSHQLELAAASESTVPTYNPNFTGRVDELIDLRDMLKNSNAGVIAGIHGLGGIGKTELALTYAHAYAGVYTGGRFFVRCEGRSSFLQAFSQLEDDPFRSEISDAERNDPQANFNATLRCIKRRLEEKGPVLLLLDNVSEPSLLWPDETGRVTKLSSDLHLLATTRLPEINGIKTLKLEELKPDDALALLEKFRSFENDAERQAAAEIVHRLGGFALAIELVAARLQVKKSLTYAGVLQSIGIDTLDTYAKDSDVVLRRHNHEKRLEDVLIPTLKELSPEALSILHDAAFLPPDRIVLPWLRELAVARFPSLGQLGPDGEDPWVELILHLARLSLFGGVFTTSEIPKTARLHRLVGDFLRREPLPEQQDQLCEYVRQRADAIYRKPGQPLDWELDGLLDTVPHLLTSNPDYPLAVDGMFLSAKVLSYRNVQSALTLLELTASRIRKLALDDPNDAQKQRDLSVSYNKLGDVYLKLGRTDESLEQFMGGLTIRRKLALDDPNDAQKQRDLMISFYKLGAVHQSSENFLMAVDEYEKGVRVLEQLIDKGLLVESSVREKEFLLSLIQQCRDGLNQGTR